MPKKTYIRVLMLWLGLLPVLLAISPHEYTPIEFSTVAAQVLLFFLSIALVRKETVAKNKPVFINFALFFGASFVFYIQWFVLDWLKSVYKYGELYFNEYARAAYFFLLAIALVYVVIDALFRDSATSRKYLIVLGIVGGFFTMYFHASLIDPDHPRFTPDVMDWRKIDNILENDPQASIQDIAGRIELRAWAGENAGQLLSPDESLRRVESLRIYAEEKNYLILLYGELNRNAVYMSVLCVVFILLFFGYQYMKDPPQGAYIDKIMFLFLVFCGLEALHHWSMIKSVDWSFATQASIIGNYVSLAVLVLIAMYFSTRLSFITSVKGEYYEQELQVHASGITRWRDAMDDLILDRFFNRKTIIGRLLVDPNRK